MVKTHGLTHVGLAVAEKRPRDAGKRGDIEHFGFRLTDPDGYEIEIWYE